MRSLFDVNLLLALVQPDHVHFDRAQEWWEANAQHGWASCPLTHSRMSIARSEIDRAGESCPACRSDRAS
jgi:predicted nucleic acid-binding protein